MRIIHFSDTHLGHSDYTAIDSETGLNQREVDIYRVFREIIDYILESKPDLVVHAGDLFDMVRPSNKAISEALQQFHRLSEAKIPSVIIAGNHSTPRQRTKETIFRIFDFIPYVFPVYGGKYSKNIIGDCAVHAIPHTYSQLELEENLSRLDIDNKCKYNIFVTHGTVQDISDNSWIEFKEQIIPNSVFEYGFDYIALGHFHSLQKIRDNAYYCGSPERLSFNEVKQEKCFLEIDLDTKSVKKIPTHTRQMIDYQNIDCKKLTPEQIIESVQTLVDEKTKDSIIRLKFDNISKETYSNLNRQKIAELMKDAIHVEHNFNFINEISDGETITSSMGSLSEEFETFLKKQDLPDEKFDLMKNMGLDYLSKVEDDEMIE
ncbi:metallophosphoesterase family protein [Nitrosopumilus sp.]|uniref:metallophosphoesterase family protein n=1 Tax=Nitrosopumilus sp. TaxID=2024843 RepID=UPI003D0E9355